MSNKKTEKQVSSTRKLLEKLTGCDDPAKALDIIKKKGKKEYDKIRDEEMRECQRK